MTRNAEKVYIIQTKWEKYPYIWVNKYVYKREKCAVNRLIQMLHNNSKGEYRIIERVMF